MNQRKLPTRNNIYAYCYNVHFVLADNNYPKRKRQVLLYSEAYTSSSTHHVSESQTIVIYYTIVHIQFPFTRRRKRITK